MGLYNPDGSIAVTVVDGTQLVGVQAADGSVNIVVDDGGNFGVYHPCGAFRVNSTTSTEVYDSTGAYYINNLLGVRNTPSSLPDNPNPDPEPFTIFTATPALNANDTNQNTSFRVICNLAELPSSHIRVTLQPGTTNSLSITNASVGKRTTGEPLYPNTTATPIPVTFNGGNGFTSATTAQTSDWIDISSLSFGEGDTLIVIYDIPSGGSTASQRYNNASENTVTWYQSGTSWNVSNTVSMGFSPLNGINYCVALIESQDGADPDPEDVDIPLTFNDSMFTSMDELTSMVTLSDGEDLTRKSFIHTNASPASILSLGNNEVTYCRVDSNECVRVTGNLSIDHCYLEATGEGEAHADTIQIYSPGERGGTLSVKNTCIRAHNTAATAGIFVADNWGGNLILEDVVFHGGPFGLRCQAGTDAGASLNVSLKNVYFVGPFGFQPFGLEEYGDGTITIDQWENVRHATIVDGELIPGELIPQP